MAPFSITVNPPAAKISGTPPSIITVGGVYIFTPTSAYPSTFTTTGILPPGLVFDAATGTLSGIPTTAGVYGNLQISATTPGGSASLPVFSITVKPVYHTLSVVLCGTDPGMISSVSPGIDFSCPSNCLQSYPAGTAITLTAKPSSVSYFSGWSGACTSSSGNCQILMDAEKTITASYSGFPTVRLMVGNAVNYVNPATLQNAYNTAADGAIVQVMGGFRADSLVAHANKIVTLAGGYDSSFTTQPGTTIIAGPLIIRSGRVTANGIKVK